MDPLTWRQKQVKCAGENCTAAQIGGGPLDRGRLWSTPSAAAAAAGSGATPSLAAAAAAAAATDSVARDSDSAASSPESAEALKNCLKKLLGRGETNDLAHQLISSSLTLVEPAPALLSWPEPAPSSSSSLSSSDRLLAGDQLLSSNLSSSSADGRAATLIDLNSLDGVMSTKLAAANFSLVRLDLVKLHAQLPAVDSQDRLEALDEDWQLYLRVLYSITAVVSILLNVITVIVLYRAKPSELRKYLMNLAIGDLLMSCLSIPVTYTEYMLGYWDFPPFLCPVVKFVVTLAVYVSVCTMVVIGVNRHVAILYPMKKCSERKWKYNKNWVICGIWLSGIIISAPEYLLHRTTQFCYNQRYLHKCEIVRNETFSHYYTIFIYLTTFAIPLLLLCYLYTSIGIQLKRREVPGNADTSRDLTMQTKRAKVVKMLIVVVVMFTLFWLPLQTFYLVVFIWTSVRHVDSLDSSYYNTFVGTYFTFHWMSMATQLASSS